LKLSDSANGDRLVKRLVSAPSQRMYTHKGGIRSLIGFLVECHLFPPRS
jgi:hypothetical protein